MNGISLTASMRSNLLSLQNISGQVSSTQNKLATGNKVNSAIDNPSSYYTARSLNNRADDLNALLDSMGQAVSTIKAATTALESATEFLEQAKAVANQALETAKVPDKSFFEEKVGENGAVVTTAQELRDAIAAGKETICVYGQIDLGDISTTGGLTLQENQKLVGVGYFGNYDTDTDKFSSITATDTVSNGRMIYSNSGGIVISDLTLNYSNTIADGNTYTIYWYNAEKDIQRQATMRNLDIVAKFSETRTTSNAKAAISVANKGKLNIEGSINLNVKGRYGWGIFVSNTKACIQKSSKINIQVNGYAGYAISLYNGASMDVYDNGQINVQNEGQDSNGIHVLDSVFNLTPKASLHITSRGTYGYGIQVRQLGTVNILGNTYIDSQQSYEIFSSSSSGNNIAIGPSAKVWLASGGQYSGIYNSHDSGQGPNVLDIAAGAKIAFEKDGKTEWYEVKENWQDKNETASTDNTITADNIKDKLNVEETSAWELPEKIEEGKEETTQDLSGDSKQYQEILNQYDSLIKDANYKGINLLQPEKLTVKFNEDNTAALEVQGRDMSSKALGFMTFDWQTQGDINKSIEELTSAINAIRNYSSELGNNYNIITTRQDFTESLTNVLTEGADKLTLADMNEESANMLALQTRQQLAINSLSLASPASQSILKLF